LRHEADTGLMRRRPPRSRPVQCLAIVIVIVLGLASRKYPQALPAVLGKWPGDALWAWMMFLMVGFLRPAWSTAAVAALAAAICFAVEFGQLIRTPWLVALRDTTLGHLVLGSGFHASDLLAYLVGIALGVAFESMWRARLGRRR